MINDSLTELNEFIRSKPDGREMLRALAVKFDLKSYDRAWITEELQVSDSFISKWRKIYLKHGVEGLKLGYQGKAAYLTANEREAVLQWVRDQERPTLKLLKQHLAEVYQIEYLSDQSYYELLHAAKMSWKKVQASNPMADPARVVKKKRRSLTF